MAAESEVSKGKAVKSDWERVDAHRKEGLVVSDQGWLRCACDLIIGRVIIEKVPHALAESEFWCWSAVSERGSLQRKDVPIQGPCPDWPSARQFCASDSDRPLLNVLSHCSSVIASANYRVRWGIASFQLRAPLGVC